MQTLLTPVGVGDAAEARLVSLIITSTALHVDVHDSPPQRLHLVVVVALESEDVVVGEHLVLRALHDLPLAVADAVDLLRREAQEDDGRLLVLGLQSSSQWCIHSNSEHMSHKQAASHQPRRRTVASITSTLSMPRMLGSITKPSVLRSRMAMLIREYAASPNHFFRSRLLPRKNASSTPGSTISSMFCVHSRFDGKLHLTITPSH